MRPFSAKTRVALLTQGFATGGGVATVARWFRESLVATGGFEVHIHDLATSSSDSLSRRISAPPTWLRQTLSFSDGTASNLTRWGANAVEVEPMRYRPRRELSRALNGYDLIQVVSGFPALAFVAARVEKPVSLQFATFAKWERVARLAADSGPRRMWLRAMTAATESLEKAALTRADALIVENEAAYNAAARLGYKNLHKVYPGVDTARFTPRERWQNDGYLLSVCRLGDPRKGLLRMIAAYADLRRMSDSVPDLVLAGKGVADRKAVAAIERAGLADRIHIHSDVPNAALPDLFRGASVYLQTSYEEGLGLSVLEAMSSGVPVVATTTDGTRESVQSGVTGWLVPQGPDVAVAHAVALRALNVLEGAGVRMSRAARERVENEFSSTKNVRKVIQVYQALVC